MLACRTGCLTYPRMTGRRLTNGPTVFVIVPLLIDLGSAASVLKGRDICFGRLQAFYITRRSCFERSFYGGFHGFFQPPGKRTQLSVESTCRQGCLCKLCCFEKHPLLRFHRSGQPLEGADARQSNREKPFANVQSPDSPQAKIHDRNFEKFYCGESRQAVRRAPCRQDRR